MTVPAGYEIDFTGLTQDLQSRAYQRLLLQFRDSPVLVAILRALVAEVQVFSDAVVDVVKYRTLALSAGANQDVLGRIVGQPRLGWEIATSLWLLEDGSANVILEDGSDFIGVVAEYALPSVDDETYRKLLLLRIACNFTKSASVPELSAAIKQATGITAVIQRSGPAQIEVLVSPDTDPVLLAMITRKNITEQGDDIFLFPFPATCEVSVVFNRYIWTEGGVDILMEDATPMVTDNIPL